MVNNSPLLHTVGVLCATLMLLAAFAVATTSTPNSKPKKQMSFGEFVQKQVAAYDAETKPVILHTVDNNPGNLRHSNGDFQNFSTPKEGYNALLRDIKIKLSGESRMMKAKLGDNYKPTLKNVLKVYAPPHENDTKNYINFVAKKAKINPNKVLTPKYAYKIVPHMIVMEKGHKKAQKYQQFAKN